MSARQGGTVPPAPAAEASSPPALAAALLRRLADAEIRNWLLVDLARRYRFLEASVGRRQARRWYWRQTLHGIASNLRPPRTLLMNLAALLASILQGVRFSLRQLLLRGPLPTLVAVVTLAIGIGSSTVIVAALNTVLLKPLPFDEADRLAMLWGDTAHGETTWISAVEYLDYRDQLADVASVASFADVARTLSGGDHPEIVGGEIQVDGAAHTLIGVIPAGVRLPIDYREETTTAVYVPKPYDRSNLTHRGDREFHALMRLADGVSVSAARQAVRALHQRWEAEGFFGGGYDGPGVVSVPEFLFGEVRPLLLILLAAAAFVLAIACANVATLVLARGESRRREIGVRVALGAGRARVARQVLTESVTLALLGGTLGMAVAWLGVRFVRQSGPAFVPRLSQLALDPSLVAIACGLSLLTAAVFGILPALHASRAQPRDLISESAHGQAPGRPGVRRGLLVGELALAVMLAVAAVLLIRSFVNLRGVDPGFRPDGVLTLRVQLPASDYSAGASRERFWETAVEQVQALPGVVAAGAARRLPLASRMGDWSITIEGRERRDDENPNGDFQIVIPGYFEAMGIEMVGGRGLLASDRADALAVVVLSEAMAATYWPGEEALGKRFRIGSQETPWYTVVGIFRPPKHNTLLEAPRTEMVHTVSQFAPAGGVTWAMTLVIRTAGDPMQALSPVRDAIRALDPRLAVAEVRTLRDVVAAASADTRFATALLSVLGAVAVVMAAAGIYGLVSYTVRQQTREIGIRMAIGLSREQVVSGLLRRSLRPLLSGLAVGLVGALTLGRTLQSLLIGISPLDPMTLGLVTALITAATLLATLVPARRAARIDPVIALRGD